MTAYQNMAQIFNRKC